MKNEIDPRIKNSYKIRILKGIRPLYENVSVAEKKNILELEYVREGLLGVDLSGYKDILDEKDPSVKAKNTMVDFPLCDEYRNIIPEMLKHLRYSQIEKYSKKDIDYVKAK